ncbi:porin family protein [Aquimarina muelleri]|uniref:Outer membrane protein beta-barrel domain-containing protein n=1 Tax=Aquimarina muelleri TaxID=279356 RepID=A0A918JSQ2_9FLAO|nr:porin family protein [Aquimarina muelleri]MCX2763036.1 PorT family protein [Aquimarina muelleri]GGX03281.1 hypothetical protein GCM10007384_01280 [Aquimarina muelleri]
MKKTLIFVVLVSFSLITIAQEEDVRFGVKTGVNLANISGDNTEGFEGRTSFHLGSVVEIPITDKFAFQPEVSYSSQGDKFKNNLLGLSAKTTMKLDYINIPLIAKYYVIQGFTLQAGPQIGFLISAKSKVEAMDVNKETDIDDNFKSIDFGVILGLGYQLDMGAFFDARYNIGLSNINDAASFDDVKQKNSMAQFSVGYKF